MMTTYVEKLRGKAVDWAYLTYWTALTLTVMCGVWWMITSTMQASKDDIANIGDCPGLREHLGKLAHPISKGNLKGFCDNALRLQNQVRAASIKGN